MEAGWTDEDFVSTVREIDASVAGVDGAGFSQTPAAWNPSLAGSEAATPVFAKDETHNVSGSHKARHLMGLLLHLAVDAVGKDARLAISSCGNAALGAATVARAAGRPIDVFIPTWADVAVVETLTDLDATIHICERRPDEYGDPCMLRFQEAVGEGALAFGVQASENRWTLDGGRTIGWELADQIAGDEPDHVFIQVGGGALLTSTAIGLLEASDLAVLSATPRVWAVQAEGCAPFNRAWNSIVGSGSIDERLTRAASNDPSLMVPWQDPSSSATGILDDVTYDWLGVARALLLTDGGSVVATEAEIRMANEVAVGAGYDVDHTGSAGYAGLLAATRMGLIGDVASAAVLMTGVRR
jgi:threonine synthase